MFEVDTFSLLSLLISLGLAGYIYWQNSRSVSIEPTKIVCNPENKLRHLELPEGFTIMGKSPEEILENVEKEPILPKDYVKFLANLSPYQYPEKAKIFKAIRKLVQSGVNMSVRTVDSEGDLVDIWIGEAISQGNSNLLIDLLNATESPSRPRSPFYNYIPYLTNKSYTCVDAIYQYWHLNDITTNNPRSIYRIGRVSEITNAHNSLLAYIYRQPLWFPSNFVRAVRKHPKFKELWPFDHLLHANMDRTHTWCVFCHSPNHKFVDCTEKQK